MNSALYLAMRQATAVVKSPQPKNIFEVSLFENVFYLPCYLILRYFLELVVSKSINNFSDRSGLIALKGALCWKIIIKFNLNKIKMLSNKQTIFAILAAAAQLGEARQLSQERQLSASWTVASDYWCTYWLDYLRNWGLLTLPTISGINTQTDAPNTCWSSSDENIVTL